VNYLSAKERAAMPITTELTEDCMGVIHVGTGTVTGSEILEGCKSVTALVESTENFHYKLVDFSATTELQITEAEFNEIVAQDHLIAASRPYTAVSIIAPNEQIQAIAKHWEDLVRELGWSTNVSFTRAKALAWLRENFFTTEVRL
jgi:hypothetical protein